MHAGVPGMILGLGCRLPGGADTQCARGRIVHARLSRSEFSSWGPMHSGKCGVALRHVAKARRKRRTRIGPATQRGIVFVGMRMAHPHGEGPVCASPRRRQPHR